ncbi:ImmA/IrrE family metallo-endopeptidase [Pseudoxanthomonas suwonensis]|uniref:ImmA/IrrE family metallo-endopeptidase n=1 Tax=Pseudoxanthomonas suwonensis TaxID=314722 RepID=UPI0018CC6AB4|nr:ImmA/IrrE family metallo-endopeptidase [Pseudoxanthomonas suwonensis]
MEAIALSREVLEWAAHRAGQTLESFALLAAKRDRDRAKIREGVLTPRQLERLAKLARVPFGYLFLAEPPTLSVPAIPDLRQTKDAVPLSADFYEVLEDALAKQEWYADYLEEHGGRPLEFVGKYKLTPKLKAEVVVTEIIRSFDISDDDRRFSPDADAYFSRLSSKVEAQGVLVIKTGFVKSNTKRTLSEAEFRGFALPHPMAPLVFVNGNDAKVAAVFTLLHELAHIWLGVSGVSGGDLRSTSSSEVFCNSVASRILVPVEKFNERWEGPDSLERVAKFFRVSKLVIARRALEQGLVDQKFYDEVAAKSQKIKKTGAPTADITIPVRNGKRFTRAVIASAMSGETLLRDAARLLNVRPDTVVSLATKSRKADGDKNGREVHR